MNVIDITVIAILLVNAILGAVRGLAWQIFRLGSIALAIWLAHTQRDTVSGFLKTWVDWDETQRIALAYLILAVGAYFLMGVLGHFARNMIGKLRMGSADRSLGFVLGGLKGAALCAIGLQILLGVRGILPAVVTDPIDGSRAVAFHVEHVKPVLDPYAKKVEAQIQSTVGQPK